MKVEVQINHYDIRILINELPHVYIKRDEFVGFQSWSDDDKMHCIEWVTTKNKFRTEYDTHEKFLEILKMINEAFPITN